MRKQALFGGKKAEEKERKLKRRKMQADYSFKVSVAFRSSCLFTPTYSGLHGGGYTPDVYCTPAPMQLKITSL